MNWRKHMVLLVGGGVSLVLLIVALIFLLRARGEYARVNQELENSMRRLETLTRRDPFPSAANIRQLEENLAALREYAAQVQAILQKGHFAPEAIEAAEFAPMLERAIARLTRRAAESGVTLPERLSLGLARYAAGELPAPDAIPRLVIQLKAMEAVCQILFQARIQAIVNIERQPFEVAPQQPAADEPVIMRRRGAEPQAQTAAAPIPMPAENPLYEVERVTVTFLARDAHVWDALNLLARAPVIAAVVDVQMANTLADKIGKAQPVAPLGGEQPGLQAAARYPTHDERVVAGRELVQVTLSADIYRFVQDVKEDAP